jgi:hypothetical protein
MKLILPVETGEDDRTKVRWRERSDMQRCKTSTLRIAGQADAPSTTLLRSVVPLPRFRGEGWG